MSRHLFETCDVCWGSHGCELQAGHDGQHMCDCCEIGTRRPSSHFKAHANATGEEYGVEGCAATWPYYGRECMADGTPSTLKFFHANKSGMEPIPGEFERLAAIALKEQS